MILRVRVAEAADGCNTHPVQVGASFRRVALKIAMQCALFLREGKLVARFCEMVHPNVSVTCFDELQETRAEDFKFLHAFGEKHRERALLFLEPRYVRVAE